MTETRKTTNRRTGVKAQTPKKVEESPVEENSSSEAVVEDSAPEASMDVTNSLRQQLMRQWPSWDWETR